MHGTGLEAIHTKRTSQHITAFLGFDKDQDSILGSQVLAQMAKQVSVLVLVGTNFNDLSNVLVTREIQRSYSNLVIIVQVVTCQGFNLLGPGSTPHEYLTVGTDLTDNLSKLRFETHVQHAISLVQDKISNTFEVRVTLFQVINQTTRSGNDNFDAGLKVSHLPRLGYTTINDSILDIRRSSKLVTFLLDLHC